MIGLGEKRLFGCPPRCGKTIRQYICPDCKTPLIRIGETIFYCVNCRKKVKAIAKEPPYRYYTDDKARKRVEELFKHKTLNCNDKTRWKIQND